MAESGEHGKTRPTRSSVRSGERHRHSSDMHKAIEANDIATIGKLLDEGDSFCIGDGLNCYILAALMDGHIMKTRWQLVQKMLDIDSRGVAARNEDGTTLLMLFANCPEKIRYLVSRGADVNDVDKEGRSVLMRSFVHSEAHAEAFEELLKLGADPDTPQSCMYQNFYEFMLEAYNNLNNVGKEAAAKSLSLLVQPEFYQKIDQSQLSRHPIFSCVEEASRGGLSWHDQDTFLVYLKQLPKTNLLIEEGSSQFLEEHSSKEWKYLKSLWNIPDTILLDPLSYYYFKLDLGQILDIYEDDDNDTITRASRGLTDFLVEGEFFVSGNKQVLAPGLALMYNAIQQAFLHDGSWSLLGNAGLILSAILSQEHVPRLLEHGDRLLMMLIPFMNTHPLLTQVVLKIMPSLPQHPITIINNLAVYGSNLVDRDSEKLEVVMEGILNFGNNLLIPGLIQELSMPFNYNDIKRLDDNLFSCVKTRLLRDMICYPEHASSLLELCRWKVREEIYMRRKDDQDLSSCIKELGDKGLVPKSLQNYLQIYRY